MSLPEETVAIIDSKGTIIGSELRSVAHAKGLPHPISAVLLYRKEDGRYMCPTASDLKDENGLYHSAAGHMPAHETYESSAIRETREECGLEITESDLELLGSYWFRHDYPEKNKKENERFQIYKVTYKPERMGAIVLNEEQVNEQWLSEDELQEIYASHPQRLSNNLRLTLENIFGFSS